MKVGKKEIAKAMKKEQARSAGRVANNEEDAAWEQLKQKLENDKEMMAAFRRLSKR